MTDQPITGRAARDVAFAAMNKEANSIINSEVAARQAKTAKLKALRLAKEAEEAALPEKPKARQKSRKP